MAEPRGPLQSTGFWLHHAALAWRRQLDSRLAELDLTHTQFNLLASANWLGRDGAAPTQQQAADLAGADRMMTSKVLAALEQRGLLNRTVDPVDTRAKRLTVTPVGRALVLRAVRVVAEIDSAIFGPAGAERDELRDRLQQLTQTRER